MKQIDACIPCRVNAIILAGWAGWAGA